MKKGTGKDVIVAIDRYTMQEVGRWPTVNEAARLLDICSNTIYVALAKRRPVYECYWVYARDLITTWRPAHACFNRVRGTKVSEKLEALKREKGL